MNLSIYLISGSFFIPMKANLSPFFMEFSGTGNNTWIFSGFWVLIKVNFSTDCILGIGLSFPRISNSSISWFSKPISLVIAKRLSPEPWICSEFQVGFTSNISYSLWISNSSTHWGVCGSFSALTISNPSSSWIILCTSFFIDLINIWSIFWDTFLGILFIFIISRPSNSCIWFLGLLTIEVIFISSIFWKIKGSSSSFFLERIIKDCKCWQIFLGLTLFDMILKAFISWISKTASESDIVSWTDSSFIFWLYFSKL